MYRRGSGEACSANRANECAKWGPPKGPIGTQKSKYEIICHLLSSGCAEPSLFLGTDAYPLRPQPAPSRWGRIFTCSADPLSLKHGSSRKNGDGKYSDIEPMLDYYAKGDQAGCAFHWYILNTLQSDGRGRRPRWLDTLLRSGKPIDGF